VPSLCGVLVGEEQQAAWQSYGGIDTEVALRGDAIGVLDAQWLVTHADRGEVLPCRQAIPYSAYLALEQLQASCRVDDAMHGLPLIIVSTPWLHPDHADPFGHTLRQLATILKSFLKGHRGNSTRELAAGKGAAWWRERRWGVVWDWASLHQHPDPAHAVFRTLEETSLFERGREAMGDLYAHPNVWVVMNSALPLGYPRGYTLPPSFHTAGFARRGWPGLEQSLFSFVKDWRRVLDLARLVERQPAASGNHAGGHKGGSTGSTGTTSTDGQTDGASSARVAAGVGTSGGGALVGSTSTALSTSADGAARHRWRAARELSERGRPRPPTLTLTEAIEQCALPSSRLAPLCPAAFTKEMALRSFANDTEDEPLVCRLYEKHFQRVFGAATLLDFSRLRWGDAEAESLADALATGEATSLHWLLLNDNYIGTRGAAAIVKALEHCPHIRFVRLDDNAISDADKIANLLLRSEHLAALEMRLELGDNLPCLPFPWEKNANPVTVRLDTNGCGD